MRFRAAAVFVLGGGLAIAPVGCGAMGLDLLPPRAADTLRPGALAVQADPTVEGARFVPLAPGSDDACDDGACGIEPGGGVRWIAKDVRVVTEPSGAFVAADQRLARPPDRVLALPDRLGGGFLFVLGSELWRADRWLGPARPLGMTDGTVIDLVAGLDRVYVGTRTWHALDPATGAPLALGPWPASPAVRDFAAADGWRAIAIADLRGLVVTSDAGATWRTVRVPFDANDVAAVGDTLQVRSASATYDVRPDGQIVEAVAGAPSATKRASTAPLADDGLDPLRAAVEDGWPLDDGTALVARDGALLRVRLDDGEVVDRAERAFPLARARCHAVRMGALRGVGFVCGEPRGATAIYALDLATGGLAEARRFDEPREVVASGSGALAVRGACSGAVTAAPVWCVRSVEGAWRDLRLAGGVGDERVVPLADGRIVVVTPPRGSIDDARLTIVSDKESRPVAVRFGPVERTVQRVLEAGMWLDGMEERRPGVLGGWVEGGRGMVGVEIDLDGTARVGTALEMGEPMVAGRYGLEWSGENGRETTDGGMTWRAVDVPGSLLAARKTPSRSCGPIGCSAAGWLRVGWGKPRDMAPRAPHGAEPAHRRDATLSLACDLADPPGPVEPDGRPPGVPNDDRVVVYDARAREALSGSTRYARVDVWGPKNGAWDLFARWAVRWSSPYGGPHDWRGSAPVAPPRSVLEGARASSIPAPFTWSIATSDDGARALLVATTPQRARQVYTLEADHPPVEVRRADGGPLAWQDDSFVATWAGGRWYLALPSRPGDRLETIVWQIDGRTARELARVPRAFARVARAHEARTEPVVLAWRTDGRALGLVVAGTPYGVRDAPRWVLPIDPDSGALGEIESLGASDLSDRSSALSLCGADDAGWVFDGHFEGAWNVTFRAEGTGEALGGLVDPVARVIVGGAHAACVQRLSVAPMVPPDPRSLHRGSPTGASMSVALVTDRERARLVCTAAP